MPDNATPHRVCAHCGREGVRDFIEVVYRAGRHAWVCENGNACLRRSMDRERKVAT